MAQVKKRLQTRVFTVFLCFFLNFVCIIKVQAMEVNMFFSTWEVVKKIILNRLDSTFIFNVHKKMFESDFVDQTCKHPSFFTTFFIYCICFCLWNDGFLLCRLLMWSAFFIWIRTFWMNLFGFQSNTSSRIHDVARETRLSLPGLCRLPHRIQKTNISGQRCSLEARAMPHLSVPVYSAALTLSLTF